MNVPSYNRWMVKGKVSESVWNWYRFPCGYLRCFVGWRGRGGWISAWCWFNVVSHTAPTGSIPIKYSTNNNHNHQNNQAKTNRKFSFQKAILIFEWESPILAHFIAPFPSIIIITSYYNINTLSLRIWKASGLRVGGDDDTRGKLKVLSSVPVEVPLFRCA